MRLIVNPQPAVLLHERRLLQEVMRENVCRREHASSDAKTCIGRIAVVLEGVGVQKVQ
jgi:hypothetical protein